VVERAGLSVGVSIGVEVSRGTWGRGSSPLAEVGSWDSVLRSVGGGWIILVGGGNAEVVFLVPLRHVVGFFCIFLTFPVT
jgi:hypothetical protein